MYWYNPTCYTTEIIDAKYGKASTDAVVDQLSHLTTDQKCDLNSLTNNVPYMAHFFDELRARFTTFPFITRCSMSRAHRKPPDTAIGRLLAPYCPRGHQGDSKQNNDDKSTNFVGRFDGCGGALVLYRAHRLMEKVNGFPKNH